MNYHRNKTIFFLFAIIFSFFLPTNSIYSQMAELSTAEMAELEELERELMEASRAIDDYVSTLPQDERDEFNRAVEEVSQMIENMSEDEFNQFLTEMFEAEAEELPARPAAEVTEEVPPIEVPVLEPVKEISPEEKKKQEYAVSVIDQIILQSNSYLQKNQSYPELPGKIEQWGKKGTIQHWQADLTWNIFKQTLQSFIERLSKLKDRDPKTNQYKYIADFISDETLYNNVGQLKDKLSEQVPQIEIPEFALQKLTTKTKQAAQKATGSFTEGFYVLNVNEGIDEVFKKYEPTAEKLRKAEEVAQKKAEAEAAKIRRPGEVIEAGAPEEEYGFYGEPGYEYGDYYGDYGYDFGAPEYGMYGKPGYQEGRAETKPSRPPKRKAAPVTPKEKKEKKELEGLSQLAGGKRDADSERWLGKLETNFENISENLQNATLLDFEKHLLAADQPVDEALIKTVLPDIERATKKAIENIKALDLQTTKLNKNVRNYYKKRLEIEVNKHLPTYVNMLTKIIQIDKRREKKEYLEKISDEKRWVYFKDTTVPKNIQTRAIALTIQDMITQIGNVLGEAQKFTGKKIEIPEVFIEKRKPTAKKERPAAVRPRPAAEQPVPEIEVAPPIGEGQPEAEQPGLLQSIWKTIVGWF